MATESDRIRTEIELTRAELASDLSTLTDRTNPKKIATRRWDSVKGGARSLRHRVMGAASDATGTMSDKATAVRSDVADTVRQAPEMITRQTQGSPMAAGLIAFGAGLLTAALIPATDTEQRLGGQLADGAQDVIEPVKRAASDIAQDVKETATSAASEVGATAKEAANRTGAQVKESGRAVADEVRTRP